ncbi:helix-turn-helix domain-containing protein [Aequorivita antarctica]|uniref:Helix-turn-helix domain-containing protein n=1 Tax=Aequorivita antarctica TaxID=153266 RepID=A0A5C6YVP7_9FLAO|nr:helix-turn-helix domain-containing protein [Aequorivita antarctica]
MKKENLKRTFYLSLKLDLIKQIERGELRVSEISKIYGLSPTAIYKWLQRNSEWILKKSPNGYHRGFPDEQVVKLP